MHVRSALILVLALSLAGAARRSGRQFARLHYRRHGCRTPRSDRNRRERSDHRRRPHCGDGFHGLLPSHQSTSRGILDYRRAPQLRLLSPRGHPGPGRRHFQRRHPDAALERSRDHHRHRGNTDARDRQAVERAQYRRRVHEGHASPIPPELERFPRAHTRRQCSSFRRRERPDGLLRACDRALRPRFPARRHDVRRVPGLPAHLHGATDRRGRGYPGKNRWNRRLEPDGDGAGDQHRHQERRQQLQRFRRLQHATGILERRQHRGGRNPDEIHREPARLYFRRPHPAGQGLVLRRPALRGSRGGNQPHAQERRRTSRRSSPGSSSSTTSPRAPNRT